MQKYTHMHTHGHTHTHTAEYEARQHKYATDNRHNKNTLYKRAVVPYLRFSEQRLDIRRH